MKGWPVDLSFGPLQVHPLARNDAKSWVSVRLANEDWLQPWEASLLSSDLVSWADRHTAVAYRQLLVRQRAGAREGTQLPFGIFVGGVLAGQINVVDIVRGALYSGSVGYWIDRRFAGRGLIPVALALVADHAFSHAGLHRLEANVRPENTASLKVVGKLGFTNEGLRRKYLAVDGHWCDHLSWSLLADDYPEGILLALRNRHPEITSSLQPSDGGVVRRG
jgi:ribosomal-protein-alanine N-acetyltransferase